MQWGMSCEGKDCQNWKRNENNFVSFEATHLTLIRVRVKVRVKIQPHANETKMQWGMSCEGKIVRTEKGMKITLLCFSYTPNPN